MRGRFTTERGRKIGIALPTGTTLVPGAILYVGADWYLKIEAAIESGSGNFSIGLQRSGEDRL